MKQYQVEVAGIYSLSIGKRLYSKGEIVTLPDSEPVPSTDAHPICFLEIEIPVIKKRILEGNVEIWTELDTSGKEVLCVKPEGASSPVKFTPDGVSLPSSGSSNLGHIQIKQPSDDANGGITIESSDGYTSQIFREGGSVGPIRWRNQAQISLSAYNGGIYPGSDINLYNSINTKLSRHGSFPRCNYVGQQMYKNVFTDASGWSLSNCSIASDTDNYKSGTASLKITCGGSSGFNKIDKSFSSTSFSGCHGMVRFYVWTGTEGQTTYYTGISSISVRLVDGAGKTSEYMLYDPAQTAFPGWYEAPIIFDDPDVVDSGFNLAAVINAQYIIRTTVSSKTCSVSFDDMLAFKSRNSKGLILLWADGTYARQYQYAAYLRSLALNGSSAKGKPSMVFNISPLLVGVDGGMSSDQLKGMVEAGHIPGMYAWDSTNLYWYQMTDTQKANCIAYDQDYFSSQGIPRSRVLSTSGSHHWTSSDNSNFLGKYFDMVVGCMNYYGGATSPHVTSLYDQRLGFYANFEPIGAMLALASSIDSSTDVITTTTQNWAIGYPKPVKITASVLPTGITAGAIYWFKTLTTTTGELYPTATDAMNATNKVNFTDTGTSVVVNSTDDPNWGKRVYALIKSKGLWSNGMHLNSDNNLTNALFHVDAFAAMVNAGEAVFVTPDEVLSGAGVL